MAFELYKGPGGDNATLPAERFIASGAITKGMLVALAAGASGAELARVSQLAGGSAATELVYGVALHTAADTEEVLVTPALPGAVYIADAAADANVSNAAADNYLTATTLTVTVGASTNQGRKCRIIGVYGAAADRKYLVRLNNTSV